MDSSFLMEAFAASKVLHILHSAIVLLLQTSSTFCLKFLNEKENSLSFQL